MKKFRFRQRISNRLEKTKLRVFEKTSWVAGNSSALMETLRQVLLLVQNHRSVLYC